MGGTSFDLSLVVDGQPTVSTETELEGLPMLMPLVDIHTIGAGGGSLAWLEAGGLRVGPQSAGADPGPACYGRGGTQPTVTDANLFLGRLDPEYFLGGRMTLDDERGRAGARLGLGTRSGSATTELAEGMLAIVNAKMADAMRTITVKQGIDPREYCARRVRRGRPDARRLARRGARDRRGDRALEPGHLLRLGDAADGHAPRRGPELLPAARRTARPTSSPAPSSALEAEGAALLEAEGIDAADRYVARSADMRYVGQEYTVNVLVGATISLEQIDADVPRRSPHPLRARDTRRSGRVRQPATGGAGTDRDRGAPTRGRPRSRRTPLLGTRTVVFDGADARDAGADARVAARRQSRYAGAGRDRGAELDHRRAARARRDARRARQHPDHESLSERRPAWRRLNAERARRHATRSRPRSSATRSSPARRT